MNLIDNFRAGAAIGGGFYSSVGMEVFAQTLYTTFIAQPEHAPRSEISPALRYALPAAAGLAALASPVLGVDRTVAASVATAAVFVASTSAESSSALEVLSNIGVVYFQLEIAARAAYQLLYTGAMRLAGRVRVWD